MRNAERGAFGISRRGAKAHRIGLCLMLMAGIVAGASAAEPTFREITAGDLRFADGRIFELKVSVQFHEHAEVRSKDKDGNERKLGRERILLIDWFCSEGRTSLQYVVYPDGLMFNARRVFQHATQDSHQRTLSAEELARLQAKLDELPASSLNPPIGHTVLVSFLSRGKWQTAVYDQRDLPAEFENVIAIVGERFETRGRHEQTKSRK